MARLSMTPPVNATTPAQKVALIIAHLGALVSVILTARWAKGAGEGYLGGLDWGDDNLMFNWHPVLMVAGMVFCFTEALLAYRTWPLQKKQAKTLHLALQSAGIILLSIGLRAVFLNHQRTGKADLWSLHSWLGIAVITAFVANYVVGVLFFFLQVASEPVKAAVLPQHVFLGLSLYFAAIFTAETGIVEKLALSGKCTAHYPKEGGVHYTLLNDGCRLANWLGLVLLLTAVAGAFAVLPNISSSHNNGGSSSPQRKRQHYETLMAGIED